MMHPYDTDEKNVFPYDTDENSMYLHAGRCRGWSVVSNADSFPE